MKTANEEVKTDTALRFFEQKYQRTIPPLELIDYKNKLLQFFSILIEIDQKIKRNGVKQNEEKINEC